MLKIILFFALVFNFFSYAKIPLGAIKGVYELDGKKIINEEYDHLSPLHGFVALSNGEINVLRFYGNFKKGSKEDRREYVEDKGLDGISKVVKILFPSPAGQLSIMTNRDDNFAKWILKKEGERKKIIPLILHYIQILRKVSNAKCDFDNFKKEYTEQLTKTITQETKKLDKNTNTEKIKKTTLNTDVLSKNQLGFAEDTIKELFNAIGESIKDELENEYYKKYTLERVILAFFWNIGNEKDDIKQFYTDLDVEKKYGKKEIFTGDEYKKIDNKSLFTIDDYTNIDNKANLEKIIQLYYGKEFFSSLTPYTVSSESVMPYADKLWLLDHDKKNIKEYKNSFSCCTEFALRRLFNTLLYNRTNENFSFDNLEDQIKKKLEGKNWTPNSAFVKLKEFYKEKQSDKAGANDESWSANAEWAKIWTDLNNIPDYITVFSDNFQKVIYGMSPSKKHDVYENNRYELCATVLNIINAIEHVFNFSLEELLDEEQKKKVLDIEIFLKENLNIKLKQKDYNDNLKQYVKIKFDAFLSLFNNYLFKVDKLDIGNENRDLNETIFYDRFPLDLSVNAYDQEEVQFKFRLNFVKDAHADFFLDWQKNIKIINNFEKNKVDENFAKSWNENILHTISKIKLDDIANDNNFGLPLSKIIENLIAKFNFQYCKQNDDIKKQYENLKKLTSDKKINSQIKILNLENIQYFDSEGLNFSNFESLEEINFHNVNMAALQKGNLPKSLKKIVLSNSELGEIYLDELNEIGIFDLSGSKIDTLLLGKKYEKVKKIKLKTENLPDTLKRLVFENLEIEKVEDFSLKNVKDMETLEICNVNISSLDKLNIPDTLKEIILKDVKLDVNDVIKSIKRLSKLESIYVQKEFKDELEQNFKTELEGQFTDKLKSL